MVDADDVTHLQRLPETADPPGKAGFFMLFPAVERVTPELTRGTECIWRYSRGSFLPALLIKFQQLRIRPGIDAVRCDEDGDVPYDFYSVLIGIFLECIPLGEEEVLKDPDDLDLLSLFLPYPVKGCFIPLPEFFRPYEEPSGVIVFLNEDRVEGIVIEPPGLITAECCIFLCG